MRVRTMHMFFFKNAFWHLGHQTSMQAGALTHLQSRALGVAMGRG